MIRLFTFGLIANMVYVASGALKQYFIAAQLAVADVGVYGAWLAQASLLLVLVPFPAYLDLLIRGFSAAPDDHARRGMLVGGVVREFRMLSTGAFVVLLAVLLTMIASGHREPTVVALLVLLVAQYLGMVADISLRLYRAHERYALFMATRNLPSLIVIAALGLRSPMSVALAELASALVAGAFAFRAPVLRLRDRSEPVTWRLSIGGEQTLLWLARVVQYLNGSLLRLVVPFVFTAHVTGLFFFACIAQIPTSLFLSVNQQLFGHELAGVSSGRWRSLLRIQFTFILPNVAYVACIALLVPFWPWLMETVPGLDQYAGIGWLVFSVALYSGVLSSDCTEFLLRSRGLSRILLQYPLCSIAGQIACLGACTSLRLPIERTIVFCAIIAAIVLASFSTYSFRRVMRAVPEHGV